MGQFGILNKIMTDKEEIEAVKQLGEAIGYGHLMALASALWRKSLKEKGYPTSGAFIGTCISSVYKKYRKQFESENKYYDKYISE